MEEQARVLTTNSPQDPRARSGNSDVIQSSTGKRKTYEQSAPTASPIQEGTI